MQLSVPFPVLFLILVHCTEISGQAPAAAPSTPLVIAPTAAFAATPEPSGPIDVTSILKKDGRFTIFTCLLQSTKVANTLSSQLGDNSNTGLTVFAPTDSAFSSLKTSMLNSFTDEQKTKPVQFQTARKPLRTQAGTSTALFSMNVTLRFYVTMPPPPPKKAAPKPAFVAPVDSSSAKRSAPCNGQCHVSLCSTSMMSTIMAVLMLL